MFCFGYSFPKVAEASKHQNERLAFCQINWVSNEMNKMVTDQIILAAYGQRILKFLPNAKKVIQLIQITIISCGNTS